MEYLADLGVFSGKAMVLTLSIIAVLIVIANLAVRLKPPREQLEVENLNEKFKSYADAIEQVTGDPKDLKQEFKRRRKEEKAELKLLKTKKKVYVLNFDGDIRASHVDCLRDEVTALLSVAVPGRDEVVLKLESTGGMVHAYGLAAAQLMRLKEHKIHLTVAVDKVAASGGYMMACTADKLIAAPFAILGSIGVIAQVPNLHRILKKHDIDYEEITAGEFKRTVSLLAEITEKGRQKFVEQLEDTHTLFKEFVQQHRPKLDIQKVATGEYWFGHRALEYGLVDELISSDEYLYRQHKEAKLLAVSIQTRRTLGERIAENFATLIERGIMSWYQKLHDEIVLRR